MESALGQKKEADGTLKLVLAEVPMAGFVEFFPQKNGSWQLVLETPRHKYIFERIG